MAMTEVYKLAVVRDAMKKARSRSEKTKEPFAVWVAPGAAGKGPKRAFVVRASESLRHIPGAEPVYDTVYGEHLE